MNLGYSFFKKQMQGNRSQASKSESLSSGNPIVVIDIGCRWGFADRFIGIQDKGNFSIYGFDPDQEECTRLQKEYQDLPEGFVRCIPLALAGVHGNRNLYITSEPACSSLYPPIKFLSDHYPALKCIGLKNVVTVEVIPLSRWARENNVISLDYIKIDTQGSELEILKGAGDLLHTTRCIDIEVEFNPIYEGQSLFSETDAYLRSKGFVLWRLSNLVHYSLGGELLPLEEDNTICFDTGKRQEMQAFGGQLYWADARYVHSEILRKQISDTSKVDRNLRLFTALGMTDIVSHMNKMRFVS